MGRASARLGRLAFSKGGLEPALLFFCLAFMARLDAQTPAIRWVGSAVEVTAAEAGAALVVFVEPAAVATADVALPAMLGTTHMREGALRFEPRFPFARGVKYRAEYRPAKGPPLVSRFEVPAAPLAEAATIVQVYPSLEALPENQLKFYVQFSGPMSRGRAYEHVRVRDAAGNAIERPFLELDEELWDPTMTRLTILIDPGRIKRGVKPLEDIGAVFDAGKRYTFTIDSAWPDAEGRPLRGGFTKPIRAQPADRTPPNPARWRIVPPAAGTRAPLVVEFDEPMDSALALRMIAVASAAHGVIDGEPALGAEERSWRLVPAQPWRSGAHRLVVPTTIEDLAGNNIGKAFDVDVAANAPRQPTADRVSVSFEVR